MATVIIGLLVAGAAGFAARSIIRDKKKGKSLQCGADCSRCGRRCR